MDDEGFLIAPLHEIEGDPATQDEREKLWIEAGHPIPPAQLLRPGSRLHSEALRLEKARNEKH